jgi:hypothetical protein
MIKFLQDKCAFINATKIMSALEFYPNVSTQLARGRNKTATMEVE